MIWLKLTSESAASLTFWIWEFVEVDQSLGTTIYSVESNFIISLGDIENKNFQTYPSPLVPAADGSKSVNVGSSFDLPPPAVVEPGAP